MGLPAVEIMFSEGNNFRMANGIVIRTHGQNMLDVIDLEEESPHRQHLARLYRLLRPI